VSPVLRLGIVGAGAMGSGIAQTALAAGLEVVLFDARGEALQKAADGIHERLESEAAKGRLDDSVPAAARERLRLAGSIADLRDAQLVIEAIVEDLASKQSLLQELERTVSQDCILATNTSSLSIAAIARHCEKAQRVCGMHFFNPVPLMRLVEIVRGPATASATVQVARGLAEALGKVAIEVADAPGFLVNLGGRAYVTEALHLQQEGAADIADIDAIMRDGCGFRMGPFELMDLTGIDVNLPVTQQIFDGFQGEPRLKTTYLHKLMADGGKFGRKTGQGFYAYANGVAVRPAAKREPRSLAPVDFTARSRMGPALHAALQAGGLAVSEGAGRPVLVEAFGEDATTVSIRETLDPALLVAIDASTLDRGLLTLMGPIGSAVAVEQVRDWLEEVGYDVRVIGDTPGFVAQRILAMVANLGCEIAQMGLASPDDIDRAMKLGLNYPEGPFTLADRVGPATMHRILVNLQDVTGSDRYRPSQWLRQRAMLGLPAATPRQRG
jgi:3-hydroxybutyryl-CoA dehydrogenase